jgi:hypothetical protein
MTAETDDRRRVCGEPGAVDDDTRAFDGLVRADVRDGWQSSPVREPWWWRLRAIVGVELDVPV